MTKNYTVKAIGQKLYREKNFDTAEKAWQYGVNLMRWYSHNRPTRNAHATMWIDTETGRRIIEF